MDAPESVVLSTFSIEGPNAQLRPDGLLLATGSGAVTVDFSFPVLGRPCFPSGAGPTVPVLGPSTITATGTGVSDLRTVVAQALSGRVGLRPVGGGEAVELVAEPIEEREIDSPAVGVGIALSGSPAERQLYDIALRADDGSWRVV